MKIAFSSLACPAWTLKQAVEAAKRYGYEGLELRLLNGDVITPAVTAAVRKQVKQTLSDAGLPVACLDTSVSLAQPDPAKRKEQVRDGLAMLDLAGEWGAPFIRVFAGPPKDTPVTTALNCAAEALDALMGRAEELGVAVALETHDAFSESQNVQEVLEKVASPSAGSLWDTHHPFRMGESPDVTLRRLAESLLHVHVKDARLKKDGNWDLVLLGEGDVPNEKIIRLLSEVGYAGWLSVEWEKKWHPEIAEPEIALPQHAEMLKKYLGR